MLHDGDGRGTHRSRGDAEPTSFVVHILFHFLFLYALFMVAGKRGPGWPPFWIMGFLCMVATYLAAWMSFAWFEAPLMVFGRRLEAQAGPRAVAAGGPKA